MSEDEIFGDVFPVSPNERGQSFRMAATCYSRMAECAMRCKQYADVEPVTIARLRSGPGCQLTLFGRVNAYTLRVSADHSPAKVELYGLPMDSTLAEPGVLLAVLYDEPASWVHLAGLMIFREGVAGSEELAEWAELSEHLRANNDWGGGKT